MGADRKKERLMYTIAELKSLETHFADMAARGWIINKINLFSCEYKKANAQELDFYVDILPKITAFDYPDNDDAREYRNICEQSGWIFAANSKQLQVFYTDRKNDKPIPIHTDRKIEAQIMMNACKKNELVIFLFGLIYLWFGWGWVIGKGYSLFLSNISMSQALSLIIITPPFLWYLVFLFIWYFKANACIKQELPIPKVSYKFTRIRGLYFSISAIVIIFIMTVGFALDIYGGMPKILTIVFIMPLMGFPLGLAVRKQIDTKNRSKSLNIKIFATTTVVFLIVTICGTAFAISYLGRYISDNRGLPENRTALTLSDFGIENPLDIYNYNNSASIAVPLNYSYFELNSVGSVRTEFKKSVTSRLAYNLYQEELKELMAKEWLDIAEMPPDEAHSWGAVEGYYLNESKTYVLLLYERSIVKIDYGGETLQDDIIKRKVSLMGCR